MTRSVVPALAAAVAAGAFMALLLTPAGAQAQAKPAAVQPAAPKPDPEVRALVDRMDSMLLAFEADLATERRKGPMPGVKYRFGPDDRPSYPADTMQRRLREIPSVIPLDYNPVVQQFIDAYAGRLNQFSGRMVGKSHYYYPLIEEIFYRHGIPMELKHLAVIESAFQMRAKSHAAAVGMWQFMYPTARQFGLRVDSYVDERQDFYKSTNAAARYLKYLYGIYGDWHLVIAAYNCGPGRVNRALRTAGTAGGPKSYWDIYYLLPKETRGYVPSYIAMAYVMHYYPAHNIRPEWYEYPPMDSITVVNQELDLARLAAVSGVDAELLKDMNPALRLGKVPYSSRPYTLRVPKQVADLLATHPDTLQRPAPALSAADQAQLATVGGTNGTTLTGRAKSEPPANSRLVRHRVRRGQTFARIANAYRVDVNDLMDWNDATSPVIEVGQLLKVYLPAATAPARSTTATVKAQPAPGASTQFHKVQRGDTLWGIAQRYRISVAQLKAANNLGGKGTIVPGQTLKIPS